MKISTIRAGLAALFTILLLVPSFSAASADEYRAFWVDAFHAGALNQSQVDKLLGVVGDPNTKGDIRNANCNAVFVEVRKYADVAYPSGMGEPYMSGLSPSNFNALQAVINAAHDTTGGKQRIDVYAWMVMFRTEGGVVYQAHSDPPTGSLTDLDNYWPTRVGSTTGSENGDQAFDPGHPLAEEYLVNVAMDVVNNFDIDGIHYDYIRFTANNEGYNPTSVARYNARYGTAGQPVASDEQWKQWRRDQITALVRKTYARIQSVKPWVKQSGAFVTWDPAPSASTHSAFQATRPYYDVYSDWDSWMQEGIMDIAVPMTYFDWGGTYSADYTKWMNFEKDRHGNRHMIVGPGIYLNSLSNAILELQMSRDPSPAGNYADGFCGYSYACPFTYGGSNYGPWSTFSPELVAQVTPTPVNIPDMPWKTSPTKGHMSGTVYDGTAWVDGANISITGPENRTQVADGTGFYAFIDLTPGTYTVTVTSSLGTLSAGNIVVTAGGMTVKDFNYANVTGVAGIVKDSLGNAVAGATISASPGSDSTITQSDGSYTLPLSPGTYDVTASKSYYSTQTQYNVPVVDGPPTAVDLVINPSQPVITSVSAAGITTDSAVITWTTNVPSSSQVEYGPTRALGSYTLNDPDLVTNHSVTLSGLTQNHIYHYRVISSNSLSQTASSASHCFFTAALPGDSTISVIVDNSDPGFAVTLGTWQIGTATAGHYGPDYRFADTVNSRTSTATCSWTPELPVSGNYKVYIWYTVGSNRSTKAPFTINYNGGSTTFRVDQQSNGSTWYQLGTSTYPFLAGTSGSITLANGTRESGKVVMADAVKFETQGAGDTTPPTVPSGLTATGVSTTQIQLNWQPSSDASGLAGYKVYRNGILIDATEGTTTYTDFGLSPNTNYTYSVAAYDIYANTSGQSSSAAKATYCLPITAASITCDKPASTWQTTTDAFTFTNAMGFGGQTIDHIRYVWDRNATHTWTDLESAWTSGVQIGYASPGGNNWYFHARAYNPDNVPNGEVDLGPYYCDITPPETPVATADRYTVSTNQLTCSWTGDDSESGVAEYEYAIGSTLNGTDVKDWTSSGTSTSVTATVSPGLALDHTYYFSVKIKNGAGVTGSAGNSGGTTVARSCASIGEAKGYPNGSAVEIGGRYASFAATSGAYVQDPDRTAALYLPGVTSLSYGDVAGLAGILSTSGLDRVLTQPEVWVLDVPAATIQPLAIRCSNLGGSALNQWTPGIDGGIGLNNLGLLIRTWGKVTTSTAAYFYISDGSREVKVISTDNPAPSYVLVTGISSWEDAGGQTVPVVIATEPIQTF